MSWTVYGERMLSTDFTGTPRVYQPFSFATDVRLKAIRTWFVHFNSPVYTTLGMRIYDDAGASVPTALRNTFTKTWVRSDILSDAYGIHEVYFDFTNPLWMKAGQTYHFAPYVVGNAFTDLSYLSWVRGFPDPNSTHVIPVTLASISRIPFWLACIGADL